MIQEYPRDSEVINPLGLLFYTGDSNMNEQNIWNYIYSSVKNPYGTAAIMGNLMAESSLNPTCVTGTKEPNYTEKADAGSIDFIHDKHAYGLVQWCYYTRKEGLLNAAKDSGVSVGNLVFQIEYMIHEIKTRYKSVWTAVTEAKDIKTASDIVMLKYEKPGTTTDYAKQKRANYGKKFFNMFYNKSLSGKVVETTADNVNVRIGNDKSYMTIGRVPKGTKIEYLETKDGWNAVKLWISGDFSEVKEV